MSEVHQHMINAMLARPMAHRPFALTSLRQHMQAATLTRPKTNPFFLPLLVTALALIVMTVISSMAGATGLDTQLNPAATQICTNLNAIAKSAFVSVIALVMFVAGCVMVWLKARGGMGMAAFGLIGFFVVKNLVPIAKSFGIVPSGITC